ncbi:hypothetical protein ID853_12495 [Xenorhabdus sp. Vera]|uniref:hypothetical protein n=1 Tax=Xenorhabdus koppenhoeferi TaxID=351659 RepID=UPI001987C26A|nr:hypothetical protein [Xenorhabdus sp. Vera]MBD2811686.1 hypothetical protein [Xenorhabdus sp. Vera]
MNKNVMVVFGLDSPRECYLEKLYNQKKFRDGNIYITIDILSSSLGLELSSDDFLNAISHFIKNKNKTLNDLYSSNRLKSQKNFYALMWCFNHEKGKDSYSITPEQEKILMDLIDPDTVHYLLNSWGDFLNRKLGEISLHDTFTRRNDNKNKFGKEKSYSNYKAGFLTKNVPFHYVKKKLNEEEMIKSGKLYSDSSLTHSSLVNTIKDKDYTHNAFASYLKSDGEGISNLLNIRHEIGHLGPDYDCFESYEKKYHGELITRTFIKSYWRKISKLAIDWVEAQAGDTNSPIKGLVFYMENDNRFKKYKEKSNIDERKFHQNWQDSDYKDIGSLDYRSPIAHSELRHARKLMNRDSSHHIELVYTNDKGILNRIKKFLNEQ